jgi:hypothetical protein
VVLTYQVGLSELFSKHFGAVNTLVRRVLRSKTGQKRLAEQAKITDSRGFVAESFTPVQNILGPTRRAEMLEEYASGLPVSVVANKYAVNRITIWKHARNAGLVIHPTELDDDEAQCQ